MIIIENTEDNCYAGEVMLGICNNHIQLSRYGLNKALRIQTHILTDKLPEGCGEGPFNGIKGTLLAKDELIQIRNVINDFIDSFGEES